MFRSAIFVTLFALASASISWSWSRTDATYGCSGWASLVSTCDAATNSRRSPVDLTGAVLDANMSLTFSPSYDTVKTVTLSNDHGKVYWSYTDAGHDLFVTVPMAGVDTEFVLDGAHMHWGTTDTGGSEHTVDGVRFTGEIHFVHYLRSDGSVAAALAAGEDHLLVIGVFVQVVDSVFQEESTFSGTLLDIFTNHFPSITACTTTTSMSINTLNLIPTFSHFYNYPGGLTTPGCEGVVQWYVYKTPHVISADTVSTCMWSASTAPLTSTAVVMGPNWRPVQAIGARTIKTSDASRLALSCAALLAALIIAHVL